MNDRELIYVKTIADKKSISKAAEKLYIAQPSLSQALQKIEEKIGTPLFLRNANGMELTYAGEMYYKTATEILNIYNDFTNEVTYVNDLKKGRLTFGITNFMGTYLLPILLPKFKEKFPNIEVYIKEENSTNLEKQINDGTIDFALMHKHPLIDEKSIKYDNLYTDPFVIATPCNHALSKYKKNDTKFRYPRIDLNLFMDENFIFLDKNKRIRQVTDIILNIAGINPTPSLTLKNHETARRLVSSGFGVMLLPMQYIKIFYDSYEADYYIIDENKYAYWHSCVATNPNMYLSKAAKVFIELVREYYRTGQPI
ncbi:MAG: LysR family transcriptional regulator [Tissierellia bacterium]|nr:LysR family transcriptional regulator [Tissierellia bacterium]